MHKFSAAVFAMFTYIAPLLGEVTGVSPRGITWTLLLIGLGLTVGNIIGANIMDLTLIMPLCALILGKPLPVERQGMLLDIPACLVVCAGALIPALVQGRFKRWVGFFIGGLYIVYLVIMFTCFGA